MERKKSLLLKFIQFFGIVILVVLLIHIFNLVILMRTTGNIISYTNSIGSETQRLVKQELCGYQDDEMISHLNETVRNLALSQTNDGWDKNHDVEYLKKMNLIVQLWQELKLNIEYYRTDVSNQENLYQNSEAIITSVNDIATELESYSNRKNEELIISEVALVATVVVIFLALIPQTKKEIQLIRKNKELEVAAYIDKITGLPGRRSCEEKIWMSMNPKKAPYCVAIFDLNNLKKINDIYGHHEGDRLIKGFAGILENTSNDRVFAGRYGGDEFLMIINGYTEEKIIRLLAKIELQVNDHNKNDSQSQIQYAVGYSFEGKTLREMIDIADEKMYDNKKHMKEKSSNQVFGINCLG